MRSVQWRVAAEVSSSSSSSERSLGSASIEGSFRACKTASSPPENSSEVSGEKARVQGSSEWVASSVVVAVLEGLQGLASDSSTLLWQRETAPSESVTAMISVLFGCHKRSRTRVLVSVICLLLCFSKRAFSESRVKNSSDPVEVATQSRLPWTVT